MTITGRIHRVVTWDGEDVRLVRPFQIAVQDERDHLRDWIWLHTRDAWIASLCDRYKAAAQLLIVTYNPATRELQSVALPVTKETP
jgi:hypothetical protein